MNLFENDQVTSAIRKHYERHYFDLPGGIGSGSNSSRFEGDILFSTLASLFRHFDLFKLKNSIVMDFGCGSGRLAKFVAPLVRKIYLVDISPKFLEDAKLNLAGNSNVEYVLVDSPPLGNLPKVDFTFSYASLECIPNKTRFFKTIDAIDQNSKQFALSLGYQTYNSNEFSEDSILKKNLVGKIDYFPSLDELHSLYNKSPYLIEKLTPEPNVREFNTLFYKVDANSFKARKILGPHLMLSPQIGPKIGKAAFGQFWEIISANIKFIVKRAFRPFA